MSVSRPFNNSKRPTRKLRSSRQLQFESLSQRIALTVTPCIPLDLDDYSIEQQGNVLFVVGSKCDDTFRVELGTEEHTVGIRGDIRTFDADVVDEIVLSGMDGNDEINVRGTSLDETVEVNGDELVLTSAQHQLRVRDSEVVRVVAGEGEDNVRISDSDGDDNVYLHPTFAAFVNPDGDVFHFSGFDRVEAFAENGGRDTVSFYDSSDDDEFTAKTNFAYMISDDFWNYAKGFERIEAISRFGGNDSARLHDSPGDDILVARPDEVVLETGRTVMVTRGYFTTRTIAEAGGNDVATLHGQDFVEDRFVWQDNSSYMYTTGVAEADAPSDVAPITASNLAIGFDHIEAMAGGSNDRAELRGSAGDDRVIALPEVVQITTPNATAEAWGFRVVRSHGRGGDDRAQLQDSDANDTYISNSRFAYLEGPGYLNYVAGFSIDVFATGEGDDYAHAQDYSGPGQDYLIFDGDQFLIWGPEREERIYDFTRARGDGAGPAGFQLLSQINHAFTIGGSHDQTDIPDDFVANAIVERSEEAFTLYEIVDGEIVESV